MRTTIPGEKPNSHCVNRSHNGNIGSLYLKMTIALHIVGKCILSQPWGCGFRVTLPIKGKKGKKK